MNESPAEKRKKSDGNYLKTKISKKTLWKLHKKQCYKSNKAHDANLTDALRSGKITFVQRTLQRLNSIWMK